MSTALFDHLMCSNPPVNERTQQHYSAIASLSASHRVPLPHCRSTVIKSPTTDGNSEVLFPHSLKVDCRLYWISDIRGLECSRRTHAGFFQFISWCIKTLSYSCTIHTHYSLMHIICMFTVPSYRHISIHVFMITNIVIFLHSSHSLFPIAHSSEKWYFCMQLNYFKCLNLIKYSFVSIYI